MKGFTIQWQKKKDKQTNNDYQNTKELQRTEYS